MSEQNCTSASKKRKRGDDVCQATALSSSSIDNDEMSAIGGRVSAERMLPIVVRLRRSGGKVIQGCDIYIGRKCTMGGWNLPQSKWANPFSVNECGSVQTAVARYRNYLAGRSDLLSALGELEGKTLGCWCVVVPIYTYAPTNNMI